MTKLHLDEPLGLAVHSLPSLQESAAAPPPSGRWKLLAIVVLCSLPVIASYFAYFMVKPQGKAGFGELILPIRPVGPQTSLSLDGKSQALATLKGQWLLVTVGPGSCAPDCQQRLFLQRQLRETLGKGKERVDWVWLIPDDTPVDPSMQKPLGDAVVLRVQPAAVEEWLGVPLAQAVNFLFVVDPMGNTMMRFPSKFDGAGASKARRDLDQLLRASVSWDAPGR